MQLLKTLFENADLPADFQAKTTALFEAAVDEKVKADLVQIQESYTAQLEEAKAKFVIESIKSIDAVVEETVLEWAKENAVPLDSEIKGQIAESFLLGLKGVFEKADIELSGDTAGKELVKLQEANAALIAASTLSNTVLAEAQAQLTKIAIKDIIAEVTVGLADTQKHRVTKLVEAFDFKSAEDFRAKAEMVVEAVGGKISGTQNADGTIIAVTSTTGAVSNTVSPEGVENEDGELVKKPGSPTNTSAEGANGTPVATQTTPFKEAQLREAPHLNSDLVAETLKLFN